MHLVIRICPTFLMLWDCWSHCSTYGIGPDQSFEHWLLQAQYKSLSLWPPTSVSKFSHLEFSLDMLMGTVACLFVQRCFVLGIFCLTFFRLISGVADERLERKKK